MLQGGDETSIPDEGGEPLSPSRGEPPLSTAAPAATPPKRSLPVPGTYVTPLITVTTTTPTPSRSSGIIIECGRCGERHSRAAGACPLPPGYASPVIQARRPGVCAICAEPFVILPGVAEKIVAVSDFPWSHLPCVLLMLKPLADLHSIEDRLAFLASTLPETVAQVPTPRRLSYVPTMLPLDRALTEGGIALAQEPFVEYVMLTRATEALLYLKDVETGPDGDMGDVLFDTF